MCLNEGVDEKGSNFGRMDNIFYQRYIVSRLEIVQTINN